jgi:hypothetical protein
MARRVLVTVACCVVVLLLGEVAARALEDDLPPVLEWHSAEAEKKVGQMDGFAAQGGADVVFFGSSLANAGLVPEVFDSAVAGGSSPPVTYNAGLSAAMPLILEPWALDVVLPRLDPQLVVIGLSSFDFTDHPSVDVFYDAFVSAPAGERAVGDDGFLDHLDRWLDDRSALWRDKAVLRNPMNVVDALRGRGPGPDPVLDAMGPLGRTAYRETQRFDDRRAAGGPPVGDWAPGHRNPAALERLVDRIHGNGGSVVLVDMPVTDEFVDAHPSGEADYETYLAMLRDLGQRTGAPVLVHSDRRDHRYFADLVHMNITGATELTTLVAEEIHDLGLVP